MRKQLLVFTALLPAFSAIAQTDPNDLEKNQLRGMVKSVTETSYKGVMKSGKPKKDEKTGREFIEYNTAGYKTKTESENFANNWGKEFKTYRYENKSRLVETREERKDWTQITKFQYNTQGKVETTDFTDSRGNLNQHQEFKYDANELLTEIDVYKSEGSLHSKIVYTYNEKKQLIKKEQFDTRNKITWQETYTYDDIGNLVEENSLDKSLPNAGSDSRKYNYNDKKQKVEESYIRSATERSDSSELNIDSFTEFFEYNEQGDVISTTIGFSKDTIVYTYDQHNNWIKAVRTSSSLFIDLQKGEPKYEIIERKIKYY